MDIAFRIFEEADVAPMTELMAAAFNEDSMLHRGVPDGPPGYDDGTFLRKYALDPASEAYCILLDGKAAGVTILWLQPERQEGMLGCLFTDPAQHSRGVGRQIWQQIEAMHPEVRIWRTETPLVSTRNLNFYINKCGFQAYEIVEPRNRDEASVKFVKRMEEIEKA